MSASLYSRPNSASDAESVSAGFPLSLMSLRSTSASLFERRLDGRAHNDMPSIGAGHRALDQKQAALCIDANDFERLHRTLDVAMLAGHALAGKHASRILRHGNRAGRIVRQRITVRSAVRAEMVAPDHAGKLASFRSYDRVVPDSCLFLVCRRFRLTGSVGATNASCPYCSLISTSTPAGRSSFIN